MPDWLRQGRVRLQQYCNQQRKTVPAIFLARYGRVTQLETASITRLPMETYI